MAYKPTLKTQSVLERAWTWIESVPYKVTARWVFYRLLQEGVYDDKAGYRHLLALMSLARKEFYGPWRPWALADDTRAPRLMERTGFYTINTRGWGLKDEEEWKETLRKELTCPLDRWQWQPVYVEIHFEAGAMEGQFTHYANPNIPLLAFHGDISIPEKWRTAERLAERWLTLRKPIHIYYYGDLDPKGLMIPESAWDDMALWTYSLVKSRLPNIEYSQWHQNLNFGRVGLNAGQESTFSIPENPERPGTYQWEALTDQQAAQLIARANEKLDLNAFTEIQRKEIKIVQRFQHRLAGGEG